MVKIRVTLATFFIFAAALLTGCAARTHVSIDLLNDPPCQNASGLVWAGPKTPDHRAWLSNWCQSVGPALVRLPYLPQVDVATSGLIVLTWNKHEGYGDLKQLLRSLDRGWAVVALLQEVSRASDRVPRDAPLTMRVPGRIGPVKSDDIFSVAEELNMSLVYVPSMPNGAGTHEDRGCAILSTLPIEDIVGIELPRVSQRRVAVMGTVSGTSKGRPWHLRVVSVHLDNRLQRAQQAAALAEFLIRQAPSDVPTLIGGDLNAWWGTEDRAAREIDRAVPLVSECGNEATFRFGLLPFRLDHLFTTLPRSARTKCFVAPDRFGSDHHPIVLHLFKVD